VSVERDRWQRWPPLAGVVFAVFLFTALGVSGGGPVDTPAEVAATGTPTTQRPFPDRA